MAPSLALVVLGSSRSDRGAYRISPGCRRVVARAEVLAKRLQPGLVVFSGWSPDGGLSEAEQMRELWSGSADAELLVEPTASSTAQNAARTLPLLRARQIEHAIVVCTPLHVYRARWFFRRLYEAEGIRTSVTAAPVLPTPAALAWELGALTVRMRQLRSAQAEVARARRER
jgi:uncharacterized SAM-binding protein YcdF (DUF218 family)